MLRMILPLFIVLLYTVRLSTATSTSCRAILSFPSAITEQDYVRLQTTLSAPLTAVTACARMRTDALHSGTLFSYATQQNHNEFVFIGETSRTAFSTLIHYSGTGYVDLHVLDGMWHLVCVTWKSSSGHWKMYTDGRVVGSGTGAAVGRSVDPGGVWILGQEQDSPGGSFQVHQAFRGDISDFNVWNYVLTDSQILQLHVDVNSYHGNVIDWETVGKLVYGAAQIYHDLVNCAVVYGEPCTDYEAVDEPTRSTGSLMSPGNVRCDSGLRTQWYRFVSPAGGEIPTNCSLLDPTSCSTLGPVWMKGTLPSQTEGEVIRQACRIGVGDCEGNCWDIKVQSCVRDGESYYVYLLPPTPGCPEAYCAGTEVSCPAGQSSENYGFTPGCTANFPNITTNPQLTNSTMGQPLEVVMLCDFDRPPWDNLTMEVNWVAGNEIFHQTSLYNGEQQAVLRQTELRQGMGKTITCQVRGRFKGGGAPGATDVSNGFFVGIKILTEIVELDENGDEKYIQLQPTLPLLCRFPESIIPCTMSVQVEFKDVDYSADRQCQGNTVPDIQSSQNCVKDFTPAEWNGILEFPVKATRDFQIDGRSDGLRYLKVGFRPLSSVIAPLWDGYQVEDVDVLTKNEDKEGTVCSSTGDPHYRSFDGKWFHVYQPGTFVLYRHRALPIEVQTRMKMCHAGNVACNCGVAIRSGNEVFIVNKCSGSRNTFQWYTGGIIRHGLPLAVRVDHHGPVGEDTRLYIANGGGRYLVYFPTGSWMKIDVRGYYLNIYIYPSADDFIDKTEGLCGTFDGNKENDGLHKGTTAIDTIADGAVITNTAFVNSWKLQEGRTLVEGVLPPAPLPLDERLYCTCKDDPGLGQTVVCDSTLAYNCRWEDERSRTGVRPVADRQHARKRRSTSYNDEVYDDDMFAFDFDDSPPAVPPPSWPAPNGMTEVEARAYCEAAVLNSPAGALCSAAMADSSDMEGTVEGCVADIQATGDTSWAEVAVTTMEESCSDILYKNTTFWTFNNETNNGTTNGTFSAPSFFFETVSCPSNCSQRGVCEKGRCVCENGYEGPSCSIETDKPPDVFFIPKEGLCDINTRPCKRTPVIGQNFLESENLTCSLQPATIDQNGVHVIDGNITVKAEFENFARVVCPLPRSRVRRSAAAGHRTTAEATLVSISNDGVRFSPPVLLITYDAVCQDCNVTGFCVLKNNSCEIDGTCYAGGDTQIGNWCNQCLPSVNVSTWSNRQDNTPPIFEPTGIIIAFIDNQLDFTVKAADPENRPDLTYSLVGAPPDPDLSLSSDGRLNWTPKLNSTIIVNITATDECGSSSTESLTVMVRDCPCQNGGSCPSFALDSPDNINCTCNGTGFTGQMCDVDVDECLNNPCVHGVCNNTVGGFQCHCEQYYTGPLCDQETPCFSYRCPDNGTCADIPGAIQCTICPEGSSGDSSLCVVIEIPLDPCSSNPCYPDVICDVVGDVYACGPCPAGMTGDGVSCVEDVGCSSQPCYPEVTCTDVPGGHECGDCPHGMMGDGKNCTHDPGVTDQQGSSWYEQPAYIALLSVGAVAVAAALIGVAVWRVKAHNATRGKVGDLPLEERRKSHPSQDLHVEETLDKDDKLD